MAKTALDIYLAAHSAAEQSLDIADPFDLEQFRASSFASGGNDKADYADFERYFTDHRATMKTLAGQKPKSATAPLGMASATATVSATANSGN